MSNTAIVHRHGYVMFRFSCKKLFPAQDFIKSDELLACYHVQKGISPYVAISNFHIIWITVQSYSKIEKCYDGHEINVRIM